MSTPPSLFNRDLSWLEFNRRVLFQAKDSRNPVLERVRFLGIYRSNSDEFFMKRVGTIRRQFPINQSQSSLAHPPNALLGSIRNLVNQDLTEYATCFEKEIRPELSNSGVELVAWPELTEGEKTYAQNFFMETVFPVLTPLSVDPSHPFPFISNLSTSFGILMKYPQGESEELFARIKVPTNFPTWIPLPIEAQGKIRFTSLYEMIGNNLKALFPGMDVISVMLFRVTRNAAIEREDDEGDDLLEMVTEELEERRFASALRLEHNPRPHPRMIQILKAELNLADEDIYELPLWLEYFSLDFVNSVKLPALKFPPANPVVPARLTDPETNIFDVIKAGDFLVHHPYESFHSSVERFLKAASQDKKVLAIKMTLYRTGDDSPFIPLLIHAAASGKQVACLVELQARFDEYRNIQVAQALEKAGVHVVYGVVGLKTHSKLALVIRQEETGVRCYVHIGTGNYHANTSHLYTDLGLFTSNPLITSDVVHLFHYLTGRSLEWNFRKILVAPIDMKTSFLRMIQREVEHAKLSQNGHIIAKINNLEDPEIIKALYDASRQGVKIELLVRSICCLIPQQMGLSENIRVYSIVGRFLEHSRIYYFRNGAPTPQGGEFFIGSADWMSRNLNERVEAVTPLEEPLCKEKCWEILSILLQDKRLGWELQSNGQYELRSDPNDLTPGSQERLIRLTHEREAALSLKKS